MRENPARLNRRILKSGIKKKVIAYRVGVHPSVLSRYLSGKCPIPEGTLSKINRILLKSGG